jgi:3-oxoacyl-[acyl-carrier protein] reductase
LGQEQGDFDMSSDRPAALVTGSATGIGRAEAVALAAAGYDVAVNYSRSESEAEKTAEACAAHGVKTAVIGCDVADDAAVKAMVAEVKSAFGRLDALCNNAGITSTAPFKDLDAIEIDEWDRVMAVNVRSIVQVTRACVPMLREAKGAIVNTASIVGLRPGPQPLAYSTSKAAVVSLTKTLALALGPDIRVNAIAPGWMEGDWMERMLGDNYDRLMERRAKMTPLKRCVTAEDVAETAVNLIVSNRFVTGEIVVIDGGFAAST